MKVDFDTLVPVERQFIVVASDNKYKALTEEVR